MKTISLDDNENFYKIIKKEKDKSTVLSLMYKDKIVDDYKELIDKVDEELKFKIYSVEAANIKDIRERYSYIYDIVCDFLDEKFNNNNICDFKENRCISVRNNSHCKESLNGCCYGRNRGLCKNFKDGKCTIKSLSCKLFTCRYLKKNKVKFKVNNIPLLKYFFNNKQKYILDTSIFKDKKEIIELLLKYNYFDYKK